MNCTLLAPPHTGTSTVQSYFAKQPGNRHAVTARARPGASCYLITLRDPVARLESEARYRLATANATWFRDADELAAAVRDAAHPMHRSATRGQLPYTHYMRDQGHCNATIHVLCTSMLTQQLQQLGMQPRYRRHVGVASDRAILRNETLRAWLSRTRDAWLVRQMCNRTQIHTTTPCLV